MPVTIIVRNDNNIAEVGPLGDSYVYRLFDKLSVPYANAASARYAGKAREHVVREDGRIEPVVEFK
jgi:hypothetical protein